jgi:hypothetical protein
MSREKCNKVVLFQRRNAECKRLHTTEKQGPRRGPPERKSPYCPRHLSPPRMRAREKAEPSFAARGGSSLLVHSTPAAQRAAPQVPLGPRASRDDRSSAEAGGVTGFLARPRPPMGLFLSRVGFLALKEPVHL